MHFKILEKVPDLFFIKKNATKGLYEVHVNYEWAGDRGSVNLFRYINHQYPRVLKTHKTYYHAKSYIYHYMGVLDRKLQDGARLLISETPKKKPLW